jgi:hypothetical protein
MANLSCGYSLRVNDARCESLADLIPKVNTADGRIRQPVAADAGYESWIVSASPISSVDPSPIPLETQHHG